MADIRYSLQIAAEPEAIYPLVSTATGFGEWWAEDVTESARTVDLGFFNRATIYRLRLEANEAPLHSAWVCEAATNGAARISSSTWRLKVQEPCCASRTRDGVPSTTTFFRATRRGAS
jgi:hypothetical protein